MCPSPWKKSEKERENLWRRLSPGRDKWFCFCRCARGPRTSREGGGERGDHSKSWALGRPRLTHFSCCPLPRGRRPTPGGSTDPEGSPARGVGGRPLPTLSGGDPGALGVRGLRGGPCPSTLARAPRAPRTSGVCKDPRGHRLGGRRLSPPAEGKGD